MPKNKDGMFDNLVSKTKIYLIIIAILFINHIYPFFKKHVNIILSKIPYAMQIILLYTFLLLFIVDTIASCVRYLNI